MGVGGYLQYRNVGSGDAGFGLGLGTRGLWCDGEIFGGAASWYLQRIHCDWVERVAWTVPAGSNLGTGVDRDLCEHPRTVTASCHVIS